MDFGNVFRGFVPTAMSLDQQNEEKRRWEVQEARNKAIFGRQEKDWARQDEVDRKLQEANDWYAQGVDAIKTGKIGDFAPGAVDYLNNTDFNGKARGAYLQGADGKHYVAYHAGEDGPPQMMEITPQMAQQSLQEMYMHRLSAADPRQTLTNMRADRQFGLDKEKVGIEGRKATNAEQETQFKYGPGGFYGAGGAWEKAQIADNATKLEAARIAAAAHRAGAGAKESPSQVLEAKVAAYTKALVESGEISDPIKARKHAWGLVMKDPADSQRAKPDVTVEVPTADGKGTAKVVMPYDEAVRRGHLKEAIPIKQRDSAPSEAALGAGKGSFVPSTARTDITKPTVGQVYVRHPITQELITQDELDRLTGQNQTLVGRGLRFFGY